MERFITVVSGLPRSGTSLMMQMLARGGMPVMTDGIRRADEDNPRGYFELEAVKKTKQDSAWLEGAEGKAVKMVYLLLRDLPVRHRYRVIMMRRKLTEVIASQRIMLERSGRAGASVSDERMAVIFSDQMQSILGWLAEQPNFAVLEVHHADCLKSPAQVAAEVNQYLGGRLDEAAMAAAVDASLHRSRGGAR